MSAGPDIAPAIAAWPPASLLRGEDIPEGSRAIAAEVIAGLEAALDRDLADMNKAAEDLGENIRKLKRKIASPELRVLDLESLILRLEEVERRARRDRRAAKYAKLARKRLVNYDRDLLQRFDRCMARLGEYRRLLLIAYRDARWELMAIDALRRGELSGPMFDDPKQLRRYLAKHAH